MKKLFIITLIIGTITSSCTYRLVDFTIISTKNIDLSKMSTFQRAKTRNVGKSVAHIVLFYSGKPSMKEAIDRTLEKTPGAIALVDGVVYEKAWDAILYGQNVMVVEGTPIVDPALSANSIPIPDYSVAKLDSKGNFKSYKEISESEYLALKSKIIKKAKR